LHLRPRYDIFIDLEAKLLWTRARTAGVKGVGRCGQLRGQFRCLEPCGSRRGGRRGDRWSVWGEWLLV